jgi:hypothetical protein
MTDTAAVLVLVTDADQRKTVQRRLAELEVMAIPVLADHAAAAIERFHPISALLDEAHAALAPDDFLRVSCSHRVRLVTLPHACLMATIGEMAMLDAVTPSPAF